MKTCSHISAGGVKCERPRSGRNVYCAAHKARHERRQDMDAPIEARVKNKGKTCKRCGNPARIKGLCDAHYARPKTKTHPAAPLTHKRHRRGASVRLGFVRTVPGTRDWLARKAEARGMSPAQLAGEILDTLYTNRDRYSAEVFSEGSLDALSWLRRGEPAPEARL